MKKTVYAVEALGHDDLRAVSGSDSVVLCRNGLRRFFRIPTTPFFLVLSSKPTRSAAALAVRLKHRHGVVLEARYPELGAGSKVEAILSTVTQDEAVQAHQGPDGWAYFWVEVDS